jgi:pimeloyl-ACP methyl ester carboxylesterase
MGHSLGGMVVLMMAERYSQYDGALSMCGFVGGGQLQVDYIANVRVLFDAFYPELSSALIPDNAVNVPPGLNFGAISSGIAAGIAAEFTKDPVDPVAALLKLLSFATVEQIALPFESGDIPFADPEAFGLWLATRTPAQISALASQIVQSLLSALYYNIVGGHDLLERTRGSAFDNRSTVYTGPLLNPATQGWLNTTVDRFRSRPNAVNYLRQWYEPSGTPKIPVLTLHTTLDPDVPFRHQTAYAQVTAAARSSERLVQQHVDRYGHCNFTAEETFGALADLVAWVELGLRPEGGDVTQ